MWTRLNTILNPFDVVRYDSIYLPDSRTLNTSLLEKIWDTYRVFDGGTQVFDFTHKKIERFQLETPPGIFDYATFGIFRFIHKLHSLLNIKPWKEIWKEISSEKTTPKQHNVRMNPYAMLAVSIAVNIFLIPIIFPIHLIHVIGNGMIRHLFAAGMTLVMLPIVLLAHGISRAIRHYKENKLANSLNITLAEQVKNKHDNSTVPLNSVLGNTPLHKVQVKNAKIVGEQIKLEIARPANKKEKKEELIGYISFSKKSDLLTKFTEINTSARNYMRGAYTSSALVTPRSFDYSFFSCNEPRYHEPPNDIFPANREWLMVRS